MSAKIHGLTDFSLVPAPTLTIGRDAEGKQTASRDFSATKGALQRPAIQAKVAKGVAITTLCSDIPSDFQHLVVDSFESRDNPGGITTISINFAGYSDSGEFGFDREITYSARGVISKRPIHLHPNFIADLESEPTVREGLAGIVNATHFGFGDSPGLYQIRQVADQRALIAEGDFPVTAVTEAWWDRIVKQGWREYDAPSMEWTKSGTNAGGLSNADIAKLGKKDTPPGSPPEPSGVDGWWQLADLSDDRSSNQSSYSLTWRFIEGEVDAKIYDY